MHRIIIHKRKLINKKEQQQTNLDRATVLNINDIIGTCNEFTMLICFFWMTQIRQPK